MKKLFKVTFFTGLLTLLKMASGFVIAKVVAIYTGPAGMAMIGQIQSIVASLNGIVAAPVGSGVVRYTAENKLLGYEACAPWWKASIQWLLALSLIITPIACFFSKQIATLILSNEKYYWTILTIALALPISATSTLIASVLNGQEKYHRYIAQGMISVIIASAIMLGLIVKYQVNGALLAAGLYLAFSGIAMLLGACRQPWFKAKYWFGRVARMHLTGIGSYVLMAATSALTVPISHMFIRNILVAMVGWEQAGLWQAVWRISEVYLGVITISLSTYYLPKLSRLKNYNAVRLEIYSSLKLLLPIVSMLALGIYLFRDLAITLLYTEAFRDARHLFAIQLLGDVIKIASWLFSYTMLSQGAVRWFVISEIVFSVSFTLFAWLFIRNYGVQGANLAYVVNYLLYFMGVQLIAKRIYP